MNFLRDGIHGLVPGGSNQDPGVLTYPRVDHVENGCTLARTCTGEERENEDGVRRDGRESSLVPMKDL